MGFIIHAWYQKQKLKLTIEEGGRRHWLVLGLIAFSVFLVKWLMLSGTPFAAGLDGYYYAIQIKSLHEWGDLIISDPSPVFTFLWLIDSFLKDPVISTKLASALLSGLLILSICALSKQLGAGRDKALIIGFLLAISPTLAQLSVDYVKNLWALNILTLCLIFWFRFFDKNRAGLGNLIMAILLSFMAFLSHRLTAVVIILFLFALFTSRYYKNRNYWLVLGLIVIILAAVLVVSKRGLQILDFLRVLPQVVMPPSLPITNSQFFDFLPTSIAIELSLAAVLFWLAISKKSNGNIMALKLALVPLLLPIYDFSIIDLGFRLFSSALPLVIVLLVLDFDLALYKHSKFMGFFAIPLILASFFVYNPRRDPPYDYYQKVIAEINLDQKDFLIVHGGLNHFYTYNKSLRYAMNFTPDFAVDEDHLWRLSYGVNIEDYRRVLPLDPDDKLVRPIDQNYILIREDVFQTYYKFIGAKEKARIDNWYNPLHDRPAFLRD